MHPTVVVDDEAGSVVVTPAGLQYPAAVARLRSSLVEACAHGLPVVVDLAGVASVDSAAAGVLLTAHKELRRQGSGLALTHATPRVIRVLNVTGLDRVLDLRDNQCGKPD